MNKTIDMGILIFLFLSYGITNMLVFGNIFESLRFWFNKISPKFLGKLIQCPMCLSMWVGMFLSAVFILIDAYSPMKMYGITIIPLIIFFDGCFTSGGVWLIHTLQEYLEKKANK